MENVGGGEMSQVPELAPKGRRVAAAIVDLFVIPIILGVLVGLLLLNAPDWLRSSILVALNIGWLGFRDAVFSPGRAMVGIKIISLVGGKVTWLQALLRNLLLVIPFVLLIGYPVEFIALLVKGERIADSWAKTRVVA